MPNCGMWLLLWNANAVINTKIVLIFLFQGITYPSGALQQRLLEDFYTECEVDPKTLSWVEAHGTGTKV